MLAKAKVKAKTRCKSRRGSMSPRGAGEAERIKAVFDRFDQNHDGMIDRGELAAVLTTLDRVTWTDKRVNALLAAMDADRDGRVSLKDFVAWLFGHRAGSREMKLDFFSTMDIKVDGRGSFLPACVRFLHNIDVDSWRYHNEILTPICDTGVLDVEQLLVILSHNHNPDTPLDALRMAVKNVEEKGICTLPEMLGQTLGFIASLVLQLPVLFKEPLSLLVSGQSGHVFLTRRQCGALLGAAFFGVLPRDEVQASRPEFAEALRLPEYSQAFILSNEVEKVLCLLCYFRQISIASESALDEVISFARRTADRSAGYSSADFGKV